MSDLDKRIEALEKELAALKLEAAKTSKPPTPPAPKIVYRDVHHHHYHDRDEDEDGGGLFDMFL